MTASQFEFSTSELAALDDGQRAFLEYVAESIRRLQPPDLDVAAVEVAVEDGQLAVMLPHRTEEEQTIFATVAADEASVSYAYEHEHFWSEDPGRGRVWLVDAENFALAAALFLEQLLLGRIELEFRQGVLLHRTRSYLINDAGERELFLRGGTLLPSLRPHPWRAIRIDFGIGDHR